jgi:hypothetical protein
MDEHTVLCELEALQVPRTELPRVLFLPAHCRPSLVSGSGRSYYDFSQSSVAYTGPRVTNEVL